MKKKNGVQTIHRQQPRDKEKNKETNIQSHEREKKYNFSDQLTQDGQKNEPGKKRKDSLTGRRARRTVFGESAKCVPQLQALFHNHHHSVVWYQHVCGVTI